MVLRAEQIFDKVYLDREHPSDFIDYISHAMKRELVIKLIDQLEDHKLRVVFLEEPGFIEDLPGSWHNQCAYRQDLECMKIVQCKNCRMAFLWCQKFRDELGGNGFCPYGKEIEGVNSAFADAVKALPSADRPQGEWIVDMLNYKSICSVCGAKETDYIYGTEMWYGLGESKFCPSCGARMKGGNRG